MQPRRVDAREPLAVRPRLGPRCVAALCTSRPARETIRVYGKCRAASRRVGQPRTKRRSPSHTRWPTSPPHGASVGASCRQGRPALDPGLRGGRLEGLPGAEVIDAGLVGWTVGGGRARVRARTILGVGEALARGRVAVIAARAIGVGRARRRRRGSRPARRRTSCCRRAPKRRRCPRCSRRRRRRGPCSGSCRLRRPPRQGSTAAPRSRGGTCGSSSWDLQSTRIESSSTAWFSSRARGLQPNDGVVWGRTRG